MIFKGAILGLAIAAIAAPASAIVYTMKISGYIEGSWGEVGPDFTASFRVDTATNSDDAITWTFNTGGATWWYAPPTYLVADAPENYYLYNDESWAESYAYSSDSFGIGRGHNVSDNVYDPGWNFRDDYRHQWLSLDFYFEGIPGIGAGPFRVPTPAPLGPDSVIMGNFTSAWAYNKNRRPDYSGGTFYALRGTSYSVSVPEPATWALMIAGFGLAGAGLRRSRPLTA